MKNIYKKIVAFGSVSLLVGVLAITNLSSAAGTATLAFSTSSSTVAKDSTVAVTVTANSGAAAMNVVTTDFSYDAAKLQFVSIDTNGSSFGIEAEGSGGGGSVAITRAVASGGTVTGSNKVVSVNFKVLGGSGTTNLSFANTSAVVVNGSDVWNGQPSALSLALTTTPTPTPDTTPSQTPTPSPTPSPTPTATDTKKTTPPASSPVVTSGQNLPDNTPVPVVNIGSAGTEGYIVTVQVFDKTGLGKPNVKVTLGDKTQTTDSLGIASFSGVVAGEYTVKANGANKKVSVVDANKTDAQNFTLTVNDKKSYKNIIIIAASIIGVVVLLIIIGKINRTRRRRQVSNHNIGVRAEDMHKSIFDTTNSTTSVPSPSNLPNSSAPQTNAISFEHSNPAPSDIIEPTSTKINPTV